MGGEAAVRAATPACGEQADDLAHLVYRVTWKFMHSDPVLAQRMRTAAVTVAACLRARDRVGTSGPLADQAAVALGELECCARLARRVGLLGEADLRRMRPLQEEVGRALASGAAPVLAALARPGGGESP